MLVFSFEHATFSVTMYAGSSAWTSLLLGRLVVPAVVYGAVGVLEI